MSSEINSAEMTVAEFMVFVAMLLMLLAMVSTSVLTLVGLIGAVAHNTAVAIAVIGLVATWFVSLVLDCF